MNATLWKLAGIGLAAYLLLIIATIPAAVVWHHLGGAHAPALGLEGTVWRGRAATLAVADIRLHDVRWRMRPGGLLRGRLSYVLDARLEQGFVHGRIALGHNRQSVTELQAAAPLEPLAMLAGYPGIAGEASLQIERLELLDGWPREVSATLNIANLVIQQIGGTVLGDFQMQLEKSDDRVLARIRDRGGPLEVQATLSLAPDRSYELDGVVHARPDAAATLHEMVALLGPADRDQRRRFGIAGTL